MNVNTRVDKITSTTIDLAIHIATAFGLTAGVEVLHRAGISPALIQRVLIEGSPRRALTCIASSRPSDSHTIIESSI